jgi:hypothetical protein
VASREWKRAFDDPIPLPRGRRLVTLEDAGKYITQLPKAEHETAEWQGAMEALILVATIGGPTMFARIGAMMALNRQVERVFDPSRKDKPGGAGSWRGIDDKGSTRHIADLQASRAAAEDEGGNSWKVTFT